MSEQPPLVKPTSHLRINTNSSQISTKKNISLPSTHSVKPVLS